jgi:hypothetical protein
MYICMVAGREDLDATEVLEFLPAEFAAQLIRVAQGDARLSHNALDALGDVETVETIRGLFPEFFSSSSEKSDS